MHANTHAHTYTCNAHVIHTYICNVYSTDVGTHNNIPVWICCLLLPLFRSQEIQAAHQSAAACRMASGCLWCGLPHAEWHQDACGVGCRMQNGIMMLVVWVAACRMASGCLPSGLPHAEWHQDACGLGYSMWNGTEQGMPPK